MPTNRRTFFSFSAALALAGCMFAQSMPAPKDSQRTVQLHDVHALVAEDASGRPAKERRKAQDAHLSRIVSYARTFIEPALAAEEDIAALSGRYLVVLGRAEQQQWVEKLLRRNIDKGYHQIDLQIRQLKVDDEHFQDLLPPFASDPKTTSNIVETAPGRYQALLDDTETNLILRAAEKLQGVQVMTAPRLLMQPMSPASIEVGNHISYIKDYDVTIGNTSADATPIRDTLFHGVRIEAACGMVTDQTLGLSFEFLEQDVQRPIPEFETTLGVGKKVTVQLPTSTMVQLEQRLELPDGHTALLAVKNLKGPHLMFLVRATLVQAGESLPDKRR